MLEPVFSTLFHIRFDLMSQNLNEVYTWMLKTTLEALANLESIDWRRVNSQQKDGMHQSIFVSLSQTSEPLS